MAFARLAERLAGFERATSADIFNAPTERVIAQGRLLVSALSLMAVSLEPTQPTQYGAAVALTLMVYLAFAAILVAVTRYRFLSPAMRGAIHVADIVIISVLLFLTDGPNSPIFFVFFIFALLAATLRWQWKAVVATAAALMGALLIVKINHVSSASTADDGRIAAIMLSASLLVAGGMLAYVSAFYKRSRQRFAILAPWTAQKADEATSQSIPQLLSHSAVVMQVPRILVIWEEAEEPYVHVTSWREGTYQETRRAAGTFDGLVNPALTGVSFLTGDVSSEFILIPKGPMRLKEPVINADLQAEFSMHGVASAPLIGTTCTGRVFIFDRSNWSDDDLLLTEIIASRTGTELDRQVAQRRNEEAIASRERTRLTRDLHDGVLQSLTAAALQLDRAEGVPNNESRSRLDLVKRLLAKEQRRIREFVDDVFPKSAAKKRMILGRDLQRQLEETAQYWNCKTSFSVSPPDTEVPRPVADQLSLMLAEAVANAVRHGGASNIDVVMKKAEGHFVINIRDNGKGFDGKPIHDQGREPAMEGIGVASVRDRVCALGGSLTVSSSQMGAQLAIRFPVP
jgi:signal transduction histidine kinase